MLAANLKIAASSGRKQDWQNAHAQTMCCTGVSFRHRDSSSLADSIVSLCFLRETDVYAQCTEHQNCCEEKHEFRFFA